MSEFLTDAKGQVIRDSRGTPLQVGQIVMYPKTVHSKGTRGAMGIGVIVGRDRYIQLGTDWRDHHKFTAGVQWFQDVKYKKVDPFDWSEMNARGVGYHESISPAFLTVVSQRFAEAWEDGTIFDY